MIRLLEKLNFLQFEISELIDSYYEETDEKDTELLLAITDLEEIIKSLSMKQIHADFQTLIK